MSRITKDEELFFNSTAEAVKFVRNLENRVRFQVHICAFLPIPDEEGRGFQGGTCITISREKFMEALNDVGRVLVDQRGAQINLSVTPAERENGLAFVVLR